MVFRLGIHREIETVVSIGLTMLAGIALVALSLMVMLPVTAHADPVAREDIALALSVVLIGLLMMVTRRNAVSQVAGFLSLENGVNLAATGAQGMPLVVEISVAFSILIAFIVDRHLPVPHPRALRHGGSAGAGCLPRRAAVTPLVLLIPLLSAAGLSLISGYRLSARINVAASGLSLLAALLLLVDRPAPGQYLAVDDLNIVFILLNTFVGFTTSAFSASYIGHEIETGRLTPNYLRFYHAMFQLMLFGMNLALLANNIGLMWVAVELATLTTVVMVGIYRTHEAIEAAWKYFILGSVGIALALFGTILVYLAARPVIGEGVEAMVWTMLITRARDFDPALLNIAFIFLLLGYGTKVGLAPMHAWLPDAHAEGPTPISAVLSGLLLNVALYALLRFKMLLAANPPAIAPGPLMIALGLISLIFAAFMLYRRRDIKRHVRLLVDRAHGHHRVRLRHGGPAGQLRRPAADDDAQPDQVGDLLLGGPCGAGEGHAAHRRYGRPDRDASGARLGPDRRRRGDRRPAAVRRVHQRVPGDQLHLRTRAAAGAAVRVRPAGVVRRAVPAPDVRRIRRAARPHRPGHRILCADVRPSRAGADRRRLAAGPLVAWFQHVAALLG